MIGVMIAVSIALIAACFAVNNQTIEDVNRLIDDMC